MGGSLTVIIGLVVFNVALFAALLIGMRLLRRPVTSSFDDETVDLDQELARLFSHDSWSASTDR